MRRSQRNAHLRGDVRGRFDLAVGSAALLATVPGSAQTIAFAGASNNIQNGAPDGLALLDESTGTVLDARSYEGEITAGNIVGVVDPVNFVEGTATGAVGAGDGLDPLAERCRYR